MISGQLIRTKPGAGGRVFQAPMGQEVKRLSQGLAHRGPALGRRCSSPGERVNPSFPTF